MPINDNGFNVNVIPYISDIPYVTQGAVVGITIGWLVGIISFYVLGMLIIRYYFKRFPQNQSSQSSYEPKQRKPSSSSTQQPAIDLGLSKKNQHQQQQEQGKSARHKQQKPRRRLYQENPTVEMIQVTQQNQTYKHIGNSNRRRKKDNLSLDQRVQN